jgi:pimeloyl-ACP methyl ester carboxylesterase
MLPLIFIHGSGHTHDSFAAQLDAFSNADAVSLPGHPEGAPLESVGDCAVWLSKYLRWKNADRAIVGGNSLGGAIAIEFALRYPENTAGLILIGAGARLRVTPEIFQMIDERWPDCIDTLAKWSLAAGAPDELRAQVKSWHLTVGQGSTRRDYANCNAFDAMERIGSIRTKTLIVVGSADEMTPVKYSHFLHEKIAGSALTIVDGAGHLAHAERPDVVNTSIRETFAAAFA